MTCHNWVTYWARTKNNTNREYCRQKSAGLFRKVLRRFVWKRQGGSHLSGRRWRNTVSGRGLNGRMHYLCSNQSQRRPRYQPAGRVSLPSATVRQAGCVACFICALPRVRVRCWTSQSSEEIYSIPILYLSLVSTHWENPENIPYLLIFVPKYFFPIFTIYDISI